MTNKRTESFDNSSTKRAIAEALRMTEQNAADQNRHPKQTPEEREQLRAALASEGLIPQPDGSVKSKS